MKKLIILLLLIGTCANAQVLKRTGIIYDELTTDQLNNALPTSKVWGSLFYNIEEKKFQTYDQTLNAWIDAFGDGSGGGDFSGDYNDLFNLPDLDYLPLAGGNLTGDLTTRNLVPTADNTYNLGASTIAFANSYQYSSVLRSSQATPFDWSISPTGTDNALVFGRETVTGSNSFTAAYTLNRSGAPEDDTDLVPLSHLEDALSDQEDTNDFVTGGSVSGEDLTLTVPNQASPVLDMSAFALDSDLGGYLPLTGGTMSGNITWDNGTEQMAFGYDGDVFELAPFAGQGFNYDHATDRWGIGNLDFQGNIAIDKSSETGREDIFTASIDDAPNDVFGISNGTVTNNLFLPVFYGFSRAGNQALLFRGLGIAADDVVGSKPYMQFLAANTTVPDPNNGLFSAPVNRTLFSWGTTDDTRFLEIEANGTVKINSLSGNGAGVVGVDNDGNLSYSAGGGSGSDTSLSDTNQTLTGQRLININGNSLSIQNGETEIMHIDPSDNNHFLIGGNWNIGYDNTTSGLSSVYLGDAIDELAARGTNNDAFSGTALTDGYTFQASDFTSGRKIFYYNGTSDIEINLPDVATSGQKLQIWQYNSGNVHIKLADGVDGISVSTVDNSNPITITKQFLTLGYRAVGTYALYDTTPTAIYSVANAANPNAEANSFTGFTVDSGPLSLSTDADAQEGSHAVRIDHNGPDNTLGLAVLALGTSLTPNTTYEFNIYLKRAAGSTGNWTIKLDAFRGWSANVASSLITTSEGNGYLLYTLTGTRNGDANSNVTFAFNSNADDADIMLIDNIVIDEL